MPSRLLRSVSTMRARAPALLTRPRFRPLRPLGPSSLNNLPLPSAPPLAGIVFDVDGTLTVPQPWMFTKMRRLLAISEDRDILAHVAVAGGMEVVVEVEKEAMAGMQVGPGVRECLEWLQERGVRKALLTRNYGCVFPAPQMGGY
jgi:phosphoglycolate phosphatase-like HAD superfamily hydrolase